MHSRLLLATLLLPVPLPAQDTSLVVIRAARMLDVSTGRILGNAVVLVHGERIVGVNPTTVPAGARTLDLGDVTLLPGFIDLHTHLGGEISATSFTEPVRLTESDRAFNAVANALKTVRAGFTTVRDFGGNVTVALGKAVARGSIVGPRVVPARNSLGITGGHCDVTGFAPGVLEQRSEEHTSELQSL